MHRFLVTLVVPLFLSHVLASIIYGSQEDIHRPPWWCHLFIPCLKFYHDLTRVATHLFVDRFGGASFSLRFQVCLVFN